MDANVEVVDCFEKMVRIYESLDDIGRQGRFGRVLLKDIREQATDFCRVMVLYHLTIDEPGSEALLDEAFSLTESFDHCWFLAQELSQDSKLKDDVIRRMYVFAKNFGHLSMMADYMKTVYPNGDCPYLESFSEKMISSAETFDDFWNVSFERGFIQINAEFVAKLDKLATNFNHCSKLFEVAEGKKLKECYLLAMFSSAITLEERFDVFIKANSIDHIATVRATINRIKCNYAEFAEWKYVFEECFGVNDELQEIALKKMSLMCESFQDYHDLLIAAKRKNCSETAYLALARMLKTASHVKEWAIAFDCSTPGSLEEKAALHYIGLN